jgi:formylglycine-generating enzyme required for sulfatase activity
MGGIAMDSRQRFAHWPEFSGVLTDEMTDRQLLGLPDHFDAKCNLPTPVDWQVCLQAPAEKLVEYIQDPLSSLAVRLAAGKILGFTTDRRIRTFEPQMQPVPGGAVQVGLPVAEIDSVMHAMRGLGLQRSWIEKETPRFTVMLDSFSLAKYPVTNGEYRAFLEDSLEPRIPENWPFGQFPAERSNHPVYGLTVDDVEAYIDWLNQRTGRRFRLPSESEWEYAAAGPENRVFPWGHDFLPDHCNTAESGIFSTTAVGSFPRGVSPFGCLDMAGNVEEYVADDYAPYPGGHSVDDDLVNTVGTYRIARGGSFTRFRDLARNCRRHGRYPRPIYVMGFRLAETALR